MRAHRTTGLLPTALVAASLILGSGAGPSPVAAAPPAPSVVASIPVGRDAAGIAADAAGIWVTGWHDRTISRIDPSTNAIATTYPLTLTAGGPEAIASGLGSLWVTTTAWSDSHASLAGSLLRVNPATGAVLAAIPIGRDALSVAVGATSVWVANRDDGTITRVDPATNAVAATIPLADVVTVAASGDSIWAGVRTGAIVRIDPATNAVAKMITTDARYPLLALADGVLWATSDATAGIATTRLLRIDPVAGTVVTTITLAGTETGGIAVAGGGVWVALWQTPSVIRVDAATNTVSATVAVPTPFGQGIAATGTDAWLLGYATSPFIGDPSPSGQVIRIGSGVMPPPASVAWKASVGASGANGTALLTASGTRGSLKLALTGLAKSATYPVKVVSGTCTEPAVTLWTAPSQKSSAAGRIAKVLVIPSASAVEIRTAGSVGPVSIRIGSGSRLRCGLLTAGPAGAPAPTPVPTRTPIATPTPTPMPTPTPTPSPTPSPVPGAGGTAFTGPYFTVTLPAGWSQDLPDPDLSKDTVAYSGPGRQALVIGSFPSDATLEVATVVGVVALNKVTGGTPEKIEDVTIGSAPGKLLITHMTSDGTPVYLVTAVTVSGGRLYLIAYVDSAGNEAADHAFLVTTLGSLGLRSTP